MRNVESYIVSNYKVLVIIYLIANFLIALFFIVFLKSHIANVEKAMAKIDRATKNAELISSVYVANIEQKEPLKRGP